jgi:leucine dehydrogenase
MNAAKSTQYAVGIEGRPSASGDPSPVTAEGVFRGIKLAARHGLGAEDLNGLTVAIQGVGTWARSSPASCTRPAPADHHRCEPGGAEARGVRDRRADRGAGRHLRRPGRRLRALRARRAINPESLSRLNARVIAGGANNQLVTPEIGRELFERGFTYAPDYVINGGGIINVPPSPRHPAQPPPQSGMGGGQALPPDADLERSIARPRKSAAPRTNWPTTSPSAHPRRASLARPAPGGGAAA